MSQVINTYGFAFDGATTIQPEYDIDINLGASSFYVELKIFDLSLSINSPLLFRYKNGRRIKNIFSMQVVNSVLGIRWSGNNYIDYQLTNEDYVYKILCVLDDGVVSLYINGMLINNAMGANTDTFTMLSTNSHIGSISSPNDYFIGILANLAIYDKVISEEDALLISNGDFDNTDSRIVLLETFNNTTKGEINSSGTEQYAVVGTETIPDTFENYIYSKELAFSKITLNLVNGVKQSLLNINRGCLYAKNVLKVNFTGRMYVDLYRGYFDTDGNLQYDISNHQLITGTGEEQTLIFRDYTEIKQNYICYYFEFEALETLEVEILEMGIIFDDFKGSKGYTTTTNTDFKTDINENALSQQEYDKYIKMTNIINKAQVQEYINVLERPFSYIHKDGCLDIETKALGNTNISIEYSNSAQQWMDATLTNIEEV